MLGPLITTVLFWVQSIKSAPGRVVSSECGARGICLLHFLRLNITAIMNTPLEKKTIATNTETNRRTVLRFSPEWWAFWAGVCAVGLTAAAALAGVVAWYFSNISSAEKDRRTQSLELAISQQQERAAVAERELVAVRAKLAKRIISDEQRKVLVRLLGQSKDKGIVRLVTQIGDAESSQYAARIEGILKDAGWHCTSPRAAHITPNPGDPHVGLVLGVRDHDQLPPYGLALRDAFAAVGIEIFVEQIPQMTENAVELMVSNKPM